MTEDDRDDELERDIADALGHMGELIPESETEVLHEEDSGVEEADLPASLERLERRRRRPRGGVTSLDDARRARAPRLLGHAVSFALGAAAAAAIFVWGRSPTPSDPTIGGADGELRHPPPKASGDEPLTLGPLADCATDCCAGSSCRAAKGGLSTCTSGRTCVACRPDATDDMYRVRASSVLLAPEGRAHLEDKRLDLEALEICVNIADREIGCRGAAGNPAAKDDFIPLGKAVAGSQLEAGLTVVVRPRNTKAALATWSQPIAVTADVLCRGVAARPKVDGGRLGSISLFLDDSLFVELYRASTVKAIEAYRASLDARGVMPRIYETTTKGSDRFSLVVGPVTRADSEKIRWQLLEADLRAEVTFGDDYIGHAKPR